MYPRTNYEMTEEDLKLILEASRAVPCFIIGGVSPASPQENSNRAWEALGKRMGFDYLTVRPVEGKGTRFFSAVPSENDTQREEGERREAEESRMRNIRELEKQIEELESKLDLLRIERFYLEFHKGKGVT